MNKDKLRVLRHKPTPGFIKRWWEKRKQRRKERKQKDLAQRIRSEYDAIFKKNEQAIIRKALNGEKIKVAFQVIFESVFPAYPLFEKMQEDDIFEPFFAISPDIARGKEHQDNTFNKTRQYLKAHYPECRIVELYSPDDNTYTSFDGLCDIVINANPYDGMMPPSHRVEHMARNGILPVYISYFYPLNEYAASVYAAPSLAYSWKVFLENEEALSRYATHSLLRGKNGVLSGYVKMDALAKVQKTTKDRKKIIIAPHHTVNAPSLPSSNFLRLADFFLELPDMYPQIDWIFRPHPLLRTNLNTLDNWGKEKTDAYFDTLQSKANVTYESGGDYWETFAASAALIHDCGSYTAEYLFTGNPACYILPENGIPASPYSPIGQDCIDQHYCVITKGQIISFIEDVVLNNKDSKQQQRSIFVENTLKINYPSVSDFITQHLKQCLQITS